MSDASGEEDEQVRTAAPEYDGTLSKWTNYIHGWQERYISLKDGTLSYYKSQNEKGFGCRGAISISKAIVKMHEFDECRFDVSVGDCAWYLRAANIDERNKWVDAIESHKQFIDSAYGSENSLRRHGSALSLGSLTSIKKNRVLSDKLSEAETYRDILCRQIDSLQKYLDATSAEATNKPTTSQSDVTGGDLNGPLDAQSKKSGPLDLNDPSNHVDFKAEAITFKATTAGIIATLTQCIDLLQQKEEVWRRRLDCEIESRKKLEEALSKQTTAGVNQSQKRLLLDGPDYEEGPHSRIKDEEFFDALDAMLDKHDQQVEEKLQLKARAKEIGEPSSSLPDSADHRLWPEIDKITKDQLFQARLEVSEGMGVVGWQLFAEEGEMKLFRRELEIDGLVCDPLKAVHTVKGVTGHEMCYHFFSPDVRWDWETTLESMKVAEEVDTNTLVFHQIHKRVWPSAQRDTVFWSHIRRAVEDEQSLSGDLRDVWIVCNKSTDIHEIPLNGCVRMKLTVSMTCETYIDPGKDIHNISRDDITCKIIYCSTINPGGWAPAAVLRALYKREYPKFLKRFTQYVISAQETKPIMF
ncbi:Pleckstrin homology domain-containing family A member 8 [Halotydeus destructor]|nr:Pleckstrin homology domain-containing family A member 8 [Halotydeus destructor]